MAVPSHEKWDQCYQSYVQSNGTHSPAEIQPGACFIKNSRNDIMRSARIGRCHGNTNARGPISVIPWVRSKLVLYETGPRSPSHTNRHSSVLIMEVKDDLINLDSTKIIEHYGLIFNFFLATLHQGSYERVPQELVVSEPVMSCWLNIFIFYLNY
jgi:hypothetical protein